MFRSFFDVTGIYAACIVVLEKTPQPFVAYRADHG